MQAWGGNLNREMILPTEVPCGVSTHWDRESKTQACCKHFARVQEFCEIDDEPTHPFGRRRLDDVETKKSERAGTSSIRSNLVRGIGRPPRTPRQAGF